MTPEELRSTLDDIRCDTKAILKRLSDGDVRFENLNGRLKRVEWVVWPAVALVLATVAVSLLVLVIHKIG